MTGGTGAQVRWYQCTPEVRTFGRPSRPGTRDPSGASPSVSWAGPGEDESSSRQTSQRFRGTVGTGGAAPASQARTLGALVGRRHSGSGAPLDPGKSLFPLIPGTLHLSGQLVPFGLDAADRFPPEPRIHVFSLPPPNYSTTPRSAPTARRRCCCDHLRRWTTLGEAERHFPARIFTTTPSDVDASATFHCRRFVLHNSAVWPGPRSGRPVCVVVIVCSRQMRPHPSSPSKIIAITFDSGGSESV